MASCPFSIIPQHYTVIGRLPSKRMTIKHRPFFPGNYVIKLWRLRASISAFVMQWETCWSLLEGGRKYPGNRLCCCLNRMYFFLLCVPFELSEQMILFDMQSAGIFQICFASCFPQPYRDEPSGRVAQGEPWAVGCYLRGFYIGNMQSVLSWGDFFCIYGYV